MNPDSTDDPAPAGILVAMLPAADLAVTASFYCRLFGLELRREFMAEGHVLGCSLGRADLPFALNLRAASTLKGDVDLSGEHPIIWRVAGQEALDRFHDHAQRLGLNPTTRRHEDAALVCVVDPDGHDVLVGYPIREWTEFVGYDLGPAGYRPSHGRPLLSV